MPTAEPYDSLMQAMKGLRLSGKHSDFTIKCGNDVYPIHKAIVCPRSEFFDVATRFGKEAEDKMIDLVTDEPEIVKLMVQYFYELDYHIPGTTEAQPLSVRYQAVGTPKSANLDVGWRRWLADGLANLNKETMAEAVKSLQKNIPHHIMEGQTYILRWSDTEIGKRHEKELSDLIKKTGSDKGTPWKPEALQNAPVVHAKMYAIANKYNIMGLKELAIDKFSASSQDHFTSKGFYDAIDIVYMDTMEDDLDLRDVVAGYIRDDIEVWGLHPRAEEKLKSVPDLAFRVMKQHFGPKGCGVEGRS